MCANQQSEQQYSTDGEGKENNACHVLSCSDGGGDKERESVFVCCYISLYYYGKQENGYPVYRNSSTNCEHRHVHGSAWNAQYIYLNVALNCIISSWS